MANPWALRCSALIHSPELIAAARRIVTIWKPANAPELRFHIQHPSKTHQKHFRTGRRAAEGAGPPEGAGGQVQTLSPVKGGWNLGPQFRCRHNVRALKAKGRRKVRTHPIFGLFGSQEVKPSWAEPSRPCLLGMKTRLPLFQWSFAHAKLATTSLTQNTRLHN